MNQLEENIVRSFHLAKKDIIRLQSGMVDLSKTQERIMEILDMLKTSDLNLHQRVKEIDLKVSKNTRTKTKTVIKKVSKRAHKEFVATKEGKEFHVINCPFAQNIKPKNRTRFKSKSRALNEGYKPCSCVK